ncbi:MAG: conjugal transfer protein TraF [Rhizobiales bacterium]|nr:conjugal transfer protein TraF [Hyphomicrobiales bacterium]
MIKFTRIILLGLLIALPVFKAQAQVPVTDAASIFRQIEQIAKMAEDLGIQNEHLTALTEQINVLKDHYQKLVELEQKLNNPSELIGFVMGGELDGILNTTFKDSIMDTINKGNSGDWSGITSGTSGFKDAINTAFKSGGTNQTEINEMANSDNAEAQALSQKATTGATTSAAAEVSYKQAGQSIERVEILNAKIPEMDSLKKSLDLNSRILAELGISMAAMWQLEAVQTVNDGLGGVTDAATIARERKFMDFTMRDLN